MRIVEGVMASGSTKNVDIVRERSASICVVLGSKKASTYSSEYASGFFEPAASHLPAAPLPRNEGYLDRLQPPLLFEEGLHLVEEAVAVLFHRHAALFGKFLEQFFLPSGQFGGDLNLDDK